MNKFITLLALAAVFSFSSSQVISTQGSTCTKSVDDINKDFLDMKDSCVKRTEDQIKTEIEASFAYLAMGTHFAKDTINRPGFSKFFFDAASEEREHAYKLIEYLSMRGRYLSPTSSSLPNINIAELVKSLDTKLAYNAKEGPLKDGLSALKHALALETKVTKSIRDLIKICEGDAPEQFNHFHFVDYLTSEFLEEQYKGQRDLAGKIVTLAKMADGKVHGTPSANAAVLAEFLFDKQLL